MKCIFSFFAVVLLASCGQMQNSKAAATKEVYTIFLGDKKPKGKEAVATFAEGCFWHTEIIFQSLDGVRDAVSGYAGGSDDEPDYEKVGSGETGHAESVNVYYDPSKVSFRTLVKAFFASHDPTQENGQGYDEGPQYRSIAFYRNDEEKKIIEDEIRALTDSKAFSRRIVTEVMHFTKFYPAEDYHQEYAYYHPSNSYVKNVSVRDYEAFRRNFREGKFKE